MKALHIAALCLATVGALSLSTMAMAKGHHHHHHHAKAAAAAPAPAICPFVLAQYCVAEKNGFKHIAWTNSCLAVKQGITIIKPGAC